MKLYLSSKNIIITFLTLDVKGSNLNGSLHATVYVILCIMYTLNISQTEKILLFDS